MNIQIIDYQSSVAPSLFTQSLKDTGFAVIKNHPIDMVKVNEIYIEWAEFFQSDYKHNYKFDIKNQDGYFPFGLENAKDHHHKDLKEFFHIYPWGCYPSEISIKTNQLYMELCVLAGEFLIWLEKNISNELKKLFSMSLENMIKNSPRNLLRIIHYPPIRITDAPQQVRAAAHEDINLLRLKKAIYISNSAKEQNMLDLLNPIINSNSVWKFQSLKFLGDYYFSLKQFKKAEQYYRILLETDDNNIDKNEIERKVKIINNG